MQLSKVKYKILLTVSRGERIRSIANTRVKGSYFYTRHTIPAANECLVSGWNVNRLEFINHYYEENMERCNLRKLIR